MRHQLDIPDCRLSRGAGLYDIDSASVKDEGASCDRFSGSSEVKCMLQLPTQLQVSGEFSYE